MELNRSLKKIIDIQNLSDEQFEEQLIKSLQHKMHIHQFIPSEKHKGYETCTECGTLHSISPDDPKILYQENIYWTYDENRSKPEEQVLNLQCIDDCGISKVDRILQFVPQGKKALEIGCFPGVLMNKLCGAGYDEVYGIEPASRWVEFILTQAPISKVIQGFFPEVFSDEAKDEFDCIIGMDVLEHALNYESFINATHRLLVNGGTAIFMSPILLEDGLYRQRDYDHPNEHVWMFSELFLQSYLKDIFSEVKFSRWIVGHELVIVKK